MSIREALHFSYAGRRSDEMGLLNISIGSGLFEEPLIANTQIIEKQIRGRDEPYFIELKREPLSFPLSFAFEESWTNKSIREIADWLGNQQYYQPLYFTTDLDRIFYVVFDEGVNLIHNGLQQGYLTLNARCNAPYSYSRVYNKIFDLTNNSSEGTTIEIENLGSLDCYPLIEIEMNGTSISIQNITNRGSAMKFTNLVNGEILTIDCKNEDIETDIPMTYRYENLTPGSKFTKFVYGINRLHIIGKARISFTYQLKRLH